MNNENKISWLERPIFSALPVITNEVALFAGIILLAIVTRFYNLDARVMSGQRFQLQMRAVRAAVIDEDDFIGGRH